MRTRCELPCNLPKVGFFSINIVGRLIGDDFDDFGMHRPSRPRRRTNGATINVRSMRRPQTAPVTYRFTVLVDSREDEEEKGLANVTMEDDEESKELVTPS